MDLATMRPRTATDVVDFGFELCRSQIAPLAAIAVVLSAPAQLAVELRPLVARDDSCVPRAGVSCAPPVWPTVVLVAVIGIALAVGLAAGAVVVGEACLGRTPDWRRALASAGRRIPTLVGVLLCHACAIAAGTLAFIVPGLLIAAQWALAVPAVMLEDADVGIALRRSGRLVSGMWGRTAGVLVLTGGIVVVLGAAVVAVFHFMVLVPGAGTPTASLVLRVVERTLIVAAALPVFASVLAALYTDARVRKEGLDMQQSLDWLVQPA